MNRLTLAIENNEPSRLEKDLCLSVSFVAFAFNNTIECRQKRGVVFILSQLLRSRHVSELTDKSSSHFTNLH